MAIPTDDQIRAVLRLIPSLEHGEVPISKWTKGRTRNGVTTLPMEVTSPAVNRLVSALYDNGFIVNFDWTSWQETAALYVKDPSRLATADLETLQKLLTTHARKDRFCGGHFTSMISNGHIMAILRRLETLQQEAL